MSVPQRVNDFISARRPNFVCNKCIAEGIGLINDTAHPAQITGALATTSDFIQEDSTAQSARIRRRLSDASRGPKGEKCPTE